MRALVLGAVLGLAALPALAQDAFVEVKSSASVGATMDALVTAVEEAGATVFARVDHAKGAESVDMELAPAQLLVFGNPKLGTPAMQDDPMAGLMLPLRVLVFEKSDGDVWLSYEDPAEMLTGFEGIADDAPYLEQMRGALKNLTSAAVRTDP